MRRCPWPSCGKEIPRVAKPLCVCGTPLVPIAELDPLTVERIKYTRPEQLAVALDAERRGWVG